MGWLDKLKAGLQKTTRLLNTDIRDLFKKQGQLVDDAFLDRLLKSLIETDVGVRAAQNTRERIRVEFRGRVCEMSDVLARVKQEFEGLLDQGDASVRFAASGPTVVLVTGVNGAGKTTSIAKLTHLFQSQGKKVLLGAADTFRAAAVEQLSIWAGRVGAEIVKGEQGGDPAAVAHRAVVRALETGADVCIIDTAGRLQTQQNLMQELSKIHRVISKLIPDAPHEVLLIVDATTGQNGISQAKHFTEAVKCTGVLLAKIDGTAKGGVVVAIRQHVGLPVKFLGVGEQAEDLVAFDPHEFVEALFAVD